MKSILPFWGHLCRYKRHLLSNDDKCSMYINGNAVPIVWIQMALPASFPDLPPPPEPPPWQTARVQGARNMPNHSDHKASSLERQPMMGLEEMKSSLDRQARTSQERHQQAQDRLGSTERGEESRRGQKNGPVSGRTIDGLPWVLMICWYLKLTQRRNHFRSSVLNIGSKQGILVS